MRKAGATKVQHLYGRAGEADFGPYDFVSWGYETANGRVVTATGAYTAPNSVARRALPCLNRWQH
jgi:hypothetical protein